MRVHKAEGYSMSKRMILIKVGSLSGAEAGASASGQHCWQFIMIVPHSYIPRKIEVVFVKLILSKVELN